MTPVPGARLLLICCVLLLAACDAGRPTDTGSSASPADIAARAVERYLTAKVAADGDALRPLLCSAMEADFQREAASFASIDARIEGMACASASSDAAGTTVRCEGKIVATYGTEDTDFPLTAYLAVQEDGDWKWCGEAQ